MSNPRSEIVNKYIDNFLKGDNESASDFYGHLKKFPEDINIATARAKQFESVHENKEEKLTVNQSVFLGMIAYYKKDYENAKKYYEVGVLNNHAVALNDIACMYRSGDGFMQNFEKALDYFERAAVQNLIVSMISLGHMYRYGEFVSKNLLTAMTYYQIALQNDKKLKNTHNLIANLYEEGSENIPADLDKAIFHYQQSAKEGSIPSCNRLGKLFMEKHDVLREIINCYKKSSSKQNLVAKYELDKIITQKDEYLTTATHWYQESAYKLSDGSAWYELGNLHNLGFNNACKRDTEQAAYCYRKAIENGYNEASDALRSLEDEDLSVLYHKAVTLKTETLLNRLNKAAKIKDLSNQFDELVYEENCGFLKPLLTEETQQIVSLRQENYFSQIRLQLNQYLITDLINIIFKYFNFGNEAMCISRSSQNLFLGKPLQTKVEVKTDEIPELKRNLQK